MIKESLVPIPEYVQTIGERAIGCAITAHRILGPGYKELLYERAFCLELDEQGLKYEAEKRILVPYKGHLIDGHRLDLIVDGVVIVELKVVKVLKELHRLQVLSYLKASGLRLGYVMNFNTELMKNGIKRVVL